MYKVKLFTIKKIEPPSNNEHPLIWFEILIIFQMKPKTLTFSKMNIYIQHWLTCTSGKVLS
jgi:hypothetical protein